MARDAQSVTKRATVNVFVDQNRKLRNGWWVAIFYLVLTLFVAPVLVLSRRYHFPVSDGTQAVLVIVASVVCQRLLRRRSLDELWGKLNTRWLKQLAIGAGIGAVMMTLTALVLVVGGWVHLELSPSWVASQGLTALEVYVPAAVAEELLFRGFSFQRLIDGIGSWPAQLLMGLFFMMIHESNPNISGPARVIASLNIFGASILLGLTYLRTRSLAMPFGLHVVWNLVQGPVLGFGVSGIQERGVFTPVLADGAQGWLTGGVFGLEASLPCTVLLVVAIVVFQVMTAKVVAPPVPVTPR